MVIPWYVKAVAPLISYIASINAEEGIDCYSKNVEVTKLNLDLLDKIRRLT